MKNSEVIKTFKLDGTADGAISVSNIKEPYGENSEDVVSIAISLSQDAKEPNWKVHIPYSNLDEVISALKEAKEKYAN